VNSLATVTVVDHGSVRVAGITGEVDLSNVDDVGRDLFAVVSPGVTGVVIDLSRTTYLDSTGIRLLFNLTAQLHTRRQPVRIVADTTIVRRVLVLTKLDEAVPFDRTVDEALAALTAGDGAADDTP
jgi:anti-anti-sigma factor